MSRGTVHGIHVSRGGVPKRPVDVGRVTREGLAGDGHAKPGIHGGPDRALCLLALERIEALAGEGHPIAPGTTGENVTVAGLDWAALVPGTCLRLGDAVRIRITGYAAPCRTIAGSFSDGRFGRLGQLAEPGGSRLYAEVLEEGTFRPGDAVVVETRAEQGEKAGADGSGPGTVARRTAWRPGAGSRSGTRAARDTAREEATMHVAYVNVYVTDLGRSVAFFEKTLGLELQFAEEQFGYASLAAGPIRLGLARIDADDPDARALAGRQTGVGFAVSDLDARHAELAARGVTFPMPPARQPWGGYMALFADPDGNVFYLDQVDAAHG